MVALFLYGLLPIVRNTATGLAEKSRGVTQAASALGLRQGAILRLIELPLASRTILAGVKTSAVINVGTATIAAFIGAGGYGERIVAGTCRQRPCAVAGRRAAGGGAGDIDRSRIRFGSAGWCRAGYD